MSTPKTDEAAVRAIIRALRDAGFTLDSVNDGGEEPVPATTETAAMEAIFAVDCATLVVKHPNQEPPKFSGVFFVLGNDPEEVAADWHVSLDPVIGPLTDSWMG